MRRSDFLTPKERLRIRWSNLKFFIYKMFHKVSEFKNWEIAGTVRIKAKKKARLIVGNTILEGGQLIIE